ncbi:hypothetical protein ACJ2_09420 [Pantoea sp. QMID2]|nr:hypothetical protein ACJ3_09440 [Pantoea sp. QMID3]GME32270.1 hypothetical protein ACJ1_09370 [Pantoea sp. QMID1]GME52093.1 hypothetical protein ACJ4_09420 [Pantoea sp. QMID4]GME53386.1 hypothetical protein ACJ2_09420 [Pantoea sp. QMID2]
MLRQDTETISGKTGGGFYGEWQGMAMRDYAKERRNYANSRAAGAALKGLLKQVSRNGQVTATLVLPLAGDVVELRTFIGCTLRHFF